MVWCVFIITHCTLFFHKFECTPINYICMRKYLIYLAFTLLGVFVGFLIFSSKDNHKHIQTSSKEAKTQLWTCSMHPQIIKKEPGDCPICGMDLVPMKDGNSKSNSNKSIKLSKEALALANIQTSVVERADISEYFDLFGRIRMNSNTKSIQSAHIAGRIEKLFINYKGEFVSKGQLIALIYSPKLVKAQEELLTALQFKETNPQIYNSIVKKLKLWKISDKQIKNLEKNKKIIENFKIYSDVSGTISKISVSKGDYVKQGQSLVELSDLSKLWVDLDVFENQISLFKIGQKLKIFVPNIHKEVSAKIFFISPTIDYNKRVFTLRANLSSSKGKIRAGMFASAKINIQKTDRIIIPASAVLWTGKRSVVYVKSSDENYSLREVEIGNKYGDRYEILTGLEEGEFLVTNGAFTIDAASQLNNKASMMTHKSEDSHSNMHMHDHKKMSKSGGKSESMSMKKEDVLVYVKAYLKIKDALVSDDFKACKKYSKKLKAHLEEVDLKKIKEKKGRSLIKKMIKDLTSISSSENISSQRSYFYYLSNDLISFIKMNKRSSTLYIKFCPMANNDKGGYWIGTDKEINNPYFGASMLRCGEVVDTLK